MQLPNRVHVQLRPGFAALVLFAFALSFAATSHAQDFHGAGVFKNPSGPEGLSRAHIGDIITAIIRVRNLDDFNDSLTITSVVDVIHHTSGDVATPNLILAATNLSTFGNFVQTTNTYPVLPGDAPILLDDAQAGGIDNHDGPNGSGLRQDFFVTFPGQIQVVVPGIRVTKMCTYIGTPDNPLVAYTGIVTNTSTNTALTNVVVIDDSGTPGFTNDDRVFFIGVLETNAFATFSNVYTAVRSPSTNTVYARGTDELGAFAITVSNTAICSVDIPCNPSIAVTKACPITNVAPGGVLTFSGTVTNTGNVTLSNVFVVNNQPAPNTPVIGPITLAPGAGVSFTGSYTAPTNTCSVSDTLTARGSFSTVCQGGGGSVTNTATRTCTLTPTPALRMTKICPAIPPAPGQQLVFTATITNIGDISVTNIVIVNSQPTAGTPVITIARLDPGQGTNFSGQYLVPTNACTLTDTLTASGRDICGTAVSTNVTQTCPVSNSPALRMTKTCPPTPPAPGQQLVFTATITNIGNISITNILIVNSQPTNNAPVVVIARLDPGQGTNFTGQYLVPTNVCSLTDTLTASGRDVCGTLVSTNVTQTCPVTNTPALRMTKVCPVTPPQAGQQLVFVGTVTNIGNIAVTNIVVVNNQPAPNTPVTVIVRLEPGQGASFTGQYIVPTNACSLTDTLIASGRDVCGTAVATNVSATCAVTNTPSILVNKFCPPEPVQPGGVLTYTGTVTNTGNVTLTNVVVVNDQPAPNTIVFGPAILAPGEGGLFTNSYVVPLDSCGPYRDTLFASGRDQCFGVTVASSSTRDCPGTNSPAIAVNKICPTGLVQPGGTLTYNGTVTNTGNITLTNVIVRNVTLSPPGTNVVFGPVTLAPGAGAAFTRSYVVPLDSCGPYRDTLIASGNDKCFGVGVTNSATRDCLSTNSPAIVVTKFCPPTPTGPGQILTFSGIVSNAGNITLTNVLVVNNRPFNNAPVFGPISLAPGQTASFSGSYQTPPDSCGPYTDTLTASGRDKCFGVSVTNSSTRSCPGITTPRIFIQKFCPMNADGTVRPTPFGGELCYSGIVSNSGDITLTNVFVYNNKPEPNTLVLGPVTLSPGQFIRFTNCYVASGDDCCGPYPDTLTAVGTDKCTGSNVVKTSTAVCPGITFPSLSITRTCPTNPIVLGQPIPFQGIISNSGNVVLSNVVVIDNNGVVIMSMQGFANGEWMDYNGTFIISNCPPSGVVTNTITIRGNDICNGVLVSASATCIIACSTNAMLPVTIISPTLMATKFGLSFQSQQGKTYTVQYIDSLAPPGTNWHTVSNLIGNGSILHVDDNNATNTGRFYRVLTNP